MYIYIHKLQWNSSKVHVAKMFCCWPKYRDVLYGEMLFPIWSSIEDISKQMVLVKPCQLVKRFPHVSDWEGGTLKWRSSRVFSCWSKNRRTFSIETHSMKRNIRSWIRTMDCVVIVCKDYLELNETSQNRSFAGGRGWQGFIPNRNQAQTHRIHR